jgi:F-type H+-transporting ATPase subunit epsilon
MRLNVLVPSSIFTQQTNVVRIIAESHDGSFGILPHRLDFVASIVPGILTYQTAIHGEVFIAVDEGMIVKIEDQVWVTVRRAFGGVSLDALKDLVKSEFLSLDKQESELQLVLNKLESGFIHQYSNLSKA